MAPTQHTPFLDSLFCIDATFDYRYLLHFSLDSELSILKGMVNDSIFQMKPVLIAKINLTKICDYSYNKCPITIHSGGKNG